MNYTVKNVAQNAINNLRGIQADAEGIEAKLNRIEEWLYHARQDLQMQKRALIALEASLEACIDAEAT